MFCFFFRSFFRNQHFCLLPVKAKLIPWLWVNIYSLTTGESPKTYTFTNISGNICTHNRVFICLVTFLFTRERKKLTRIVSFTVDMILLVFTLFTHYSLSCLLSPCRWKSFHQTQYHVKLNITLMGRLTLCTVKFSSIESAVDLHLICWWRNCQLSRERRETGRKKWSRCQLFYTLEKTNPETDVIV